MESLGRLINKTEFREIDRTHTITRHSTQNNTNTTQNKIYFFKSELALYSNFLIS